MSAHTPFIDRPFDNGVGRDGGVPGANPDHSVLVSDAFVTIDEDEMHAHVLYPRVNTFKDSGATDHCYVRREDFTTYSTIPIRHGKAAKRGTQFSIVGIGSVTKILPVEGRLVSMTFTNVLHTPDLSANLISVSRLDSMGCTTTFGGGKFVVRDKNGKSCLEGQMVNRMYMVNEGGSAAMAARSHEKPTTLETWHRRFGHAGITGIKRLETKSLVDGLKITDTTLHGMCEDCIYGKHTRRPFDEIVTHETEVLERVHIDLWGPARVTSRGGKRYMMGITDGHSKYPTAYFLENKRAETSLAAFRAYHLMAERQTGKKLRIVRVDGGGEFDNGLWQNYFEEHGLIIEFTAPYSSSQNGVAEREFRTVADGTRVTMAE